jgi:hypothetical protein
MILTSCVKGGSSQGKSGWIIQFKYDAEFIEKFKKTINHQHREWRPETKTWWVDEVYEPELDQLFDNWYALAKMQGTLL